MAADPLAAVAAARVASMNLNLTAEEKRVFYQLFQAADTTNLGVITGEIAVPFFERTKLSPDTLGLIWQIADKENRGLLTPSGFSIVLRLIGHAQAGRAPSEELALQAGPLPKFEGIVVDNTAAAPSPRASESGATSPPPPTAGAGPVRVPPLNPDDVNKFTSLFEKSDVRNGVLSGETAKQIFERARLPNEILGRIWNLADTKQRGALDVTEFVIAMHLLTSCKSGAMRGVPQTLPPGLYEAAARRAPARSSTGSRSELDVPPVPTIPRQFTGPPVQRTQSPITRPPFAAPLSAHTTGGDWLITPPEKAHFDSIFATVDTAKSGYLSGDQAVTFFMNAKLPEETLAQIWDLADIDADGQLSRDEFAVAMYLVRLQRSGRESLPQVLPPALIPPSMRRAAAGRPGTVPAAAAAPAHAPPAPVPAPRSATDDLFGLDNFSGPAPAAPPPQVAQSTGGSNAQFHTPSSPTSRSSPQIASTVFRPFVPSSTFGQTLQPQLTGASASQRSMVRSPPPPSDDLLGDNDPEESKKLTQETAELANLSNQIGSLAKEMQTVQEKRTSAEQNLSQTSQQKRDFEARLAQARSMYEQEVKSFKALEEKLNASRAETGKLQQEYALIEGSRQDLQNQYNQVATALAADQQENATLKEKIRQANAQVAQLKPALEKARSDARQQKGLVAINKKQLATVEGERDKLQSEIDTVSRDIPLSEEAAEAATATSSGAAAAAAAAAAAPVTSPAASTTSQNTNPFFRRTTTASSEGAFSPSVSNEQQRAFDSLFGAAAAAPTSPIPPPPTTFRADSPAAVLPPPVFKSPVTSGAPTPSISPPPQLSQSRTMTPSVLPLADAQSFTSSTKVSPPASRFGGVESTRDGTPALENPSEAAQPTTDKSPTQSPFDESEETKARFPELPVTAEEPSAAPIGDQTKDPSFDELFGGISRERSQSQKASDFDEAFSAMRNGPSSEKSTSAAAGAAPASEFPPIREFDDNDDDDDESSVGEAAMGFEDNFNPASGGPDTREDNSESIDATQLDAFPAPGTFPGAFPSDAPSTPAPAPASQPPPPAPDAQNSPPTYDEAASNGNDNKSQTQGNFPPEFNGLLPSREDPTAAPDAPHTVDSSTGAPIVRGEAQTKAPAPDFEAAFAGLDLAPAKEAEDDDDEDEDGDEEDEDGDEEEDDRDGPDSHFHSKQPSDFDFTFDSPPSPQQLKTAPPHENAGSAPDDFFNFEKNAATTGPFVTGASPSGGTADNTKQTTAAETAGTTAASMHDWDALFAPLDSKQPQPQQSDGVPGGEQSNGTSSANANANARPPGWALVADTGEDDQILQKLTGMGFPRDEALAALEKFDYNIDKAADFLTTKTTTTTTA